MRGLRIYIIAMFALSLSIGVSTASAENLRGIKKGDCDPSRFKPSRRLTVEELNTRVTRDLADATPTPRRDPAGTPPPIPKDAGVKLTARQAELRQIKAMYGANTEVVVLDATGKPVVAGPITRIADGGRKVKVRGQVFDTEKYKIVSKNAYAKAKARTPGDLPFEEWRKVVGQRTRTVKGLFESGEDAVFVNANGEIVGIGKVKDFAGETAHMADGTLISYRNNRVFKASDFFSSSEGKKATTNFLDKSQGKEVSLYLKSATDKPVRVTVLGRNNKQLIINVDGNSTAGIRRVPLNDVHAAGPVTSNAKRVPVQQTSTANAKIDPSLIINRQNKVTRYMDENTTVVLVDRRGRVIYVGKIKDYEGAVVYFKKKPKGDPLPGSPNVSRDDLMTRYDGVSVFDSDRFGDILPLSEYLDIAKKQGRNVSFTNNNQVVSGVVTDVRSTNGAVEVTVGGRTVVLEDVKSVKVSGDPIVQPKPNEVATGSSTNTGRSVATSKKKPSTDTDATKVVGGKVPEDAPNFTEIYNYFRDTIFGSKNPPVAKRNSPPPSVNPKDPVHPNVKPSTDFDPTKVVDYKDPRFGLVQPTKEVAKGANGAAGSSATPPPIPQKQSGQVVSSPTPPPPPVPKKTPKKKVEQSFARGTPPPTPVPSLSRTSFSGDAFRPKRVKKPKKKTVSAEFSGKPPGAKPKKKGDDLSLDNIDDIPELDPSLLTAEPPPLPAGISKPKVNAGTTGPKQASNEHKRKLKRLSRKLASDPEYAEKSAQAVINDLTREAEIEANMLAKKSNIYSGNMRQNRRKKAVLPEPTHIRQKKEYAALKEMRKPDRSVAYTGYAKDLTTGKSLTRDEVQRKFKFMTLDESRSIAGKKPTKTTLSQKIHNVYEAGDVDAVIIYKKPIEGKPGQVDLVEIQGRIDWDSAAALNKGSGNRDLIVTGVGKDRGLGWIRIKADQLVDIGLKRKNIFDQAEVASRLKSSGNPYGRQVFMRLRGDDRGFVTVVNSVNRNAEAVEVLVPKGNSWEVVSVHVDDIAEFGLRRG